MADIQTLILYGSIFISLFFEVFLLITYLEVREELILEKNIDKNIKRFPTVTVIVPCFNEEKTLTMTMWSLLNLDYPKDKLSIIAVDDGSVDRTLFELNKFESYQQVTVLSKENGGKHTALNLALEKVKSDLVGCLDADSFVNPEALKKIVPFFEDQSTMAVTPSVKVTIFFRASGLTNESASRHPTRSHLTFSKAKLRAVCLPPFSFDKTVTCW